MGSTAHIFFLLRQSILFISYIINAIHKQYQLTKSKVYATSAGGSEQEPSLNIQDEPATVIAG
jgi:hypothetical protein